jgi:hypothetical protein
VSNADLRLSRIAFQYIGVFPRKGYPRQMLAQENGFIVLSLDPAPESHIRTLLSFMGQIFGSAKYFVAHPSMVVPFYSPVEQTLTQII